MPAIGKWVTFLLAIMIAASLLVTYAQQVVPLVPAFNTTSNVVVIGNMSSQYVSKLLGYALFFTNLWDMGSGTSGSTILMYNAAEGVAYYIRNYTFIKPTYSYDVTLGYPAIFYGHSQWGGLYPKMSPLLMLPAQVISLPGIWAYVNYSTVKFTPGNLQFDLSLQVWLGATPNETSGAQPGDLEVIIYYYTHNMAPGGSNMGTITVPTFVNGSIVDESWQVWVYYGGSSMWTIAWFVPSINQPSGYVGLNITGMLYDLFNILVTNWPLQWNFTGLLNYYLFQLGNDFGTSSQLSNVFENITVYKYYLELTKPLIPIITVTNTTTTTVTTTATTYVTSTVTSTTTTTVTSTTTSVSTTTVTSPVTSTTTLTTTSLLTTTSTATLVSTLTSTLTVTKEVIGTSVIVGIVIIVIVIAVIAALLVRRR
ncbi:ABC transporter substrate-binding protein [Caldivirga maquilingensis]|uniref:Solute binding protein-like protein n=1 Tax=Caldivirga maquilingensis (strain ATCC 700844 / DSM 13496 / JCM 10307 / IC-167) TaxID=397948 RepID=A8MBW6_CALMQ|nr:ABC transporter substrate-binding protein [Caldivirga maquilingensis]ABW01309.1 solute binding protein-like protein [Caldivirga maquilingensis IC-167]